MRRRSERRWQAVAIYLRGCEPPWARTVDIWRTVRVGPGALHALLARMERLGVVVSRWDTEGVQGRPRWRLYALASRVGSWVGTDG